MKNKEGGFMKALNYLENRGFYIILVLCVLSIGISGYVLFFTGENDIMDDPAYIADLPEDGAAEPDFEVPPVNSDLTEDGEDAETAAEPETPADSEQPAESESPGRTEAVMRPTVPQKAPEPEFVRPVPGGVIRSFSGDELVYSETMRDWRVHTGTDFAVQAGEQVVSVMAGVVEDVYNDELYGTCVLVDHQNGLKTLYTGLMEETAVGAGDKVRAGTVLGGAGQTSLLEAGGDLCLHVELFVNGERGDFENILPDE